MSLAGLRVLSLESRRGAEMATLIARYEGLPIIAPSVKEKAIPESEAAVRFITDLEADAYDLIICMTGVGVNFLLESLAPHMPTERISAALRRATVLSRGPKPVGPLRGIGVAIDVMISEPNTWREIVAAVQLRPERRIAVLEYGRPNHEMTRALEDLQAHVTTVALYFWELPDDLTPLRLAAHQLAESEADLVLFTSSIQLEHLLKISDQEGVGEQVRFALKERILIGSIGPVMTESLESHGFLAHITPKHPKMPSLVKAAAELAPELLRQRREAREKPATSTKDTT